jgi:hypothetical protein
MFVLILIGIFTQAEVCGDCHTDIYKEWSNSLHAASLSDPVFREGFKEIEKEEDRRICIRCHAPTVLLTNDYEMNLPITKEGVTCDFCHSIVSIDLKREPPFHVKPGNVKRGPFPFILESLEIGHRSEYSALFTDSKFCATCHQVVNRKGIKVLNTYEEWLNSPYPSEGIHCQNCHMPQVPGTKIVDPEIYPSERIVTAHRFLGGHSKINISKAAKVTMMSDYRKDTLVVTVYVTNEESGHKLPTGIPSRKLVLSVRIFDEEGNVIGEKKTFYRRVLLDEEGNEIKTIEDFFLKASREIQDNRIAPRETRREEFKFFIPGKKYNSVNILTELRYEFRVPFLEPNVMSMEISKIIKTHNLRVKATRGFSYWFTVSILVFICFAIVVLLINRLILRR